MQGKKKNGDWVNKFFINKRAVVVSCTKTGASNKSRCPYMITGASNELMKGQTY